VLAEGMAYVERAPWAVLTPSVGLVLLSALAVSVSSLSRVRRRRPLAELEPAPDPLPVVQQA